MLVPLVVLDLRLPDRQPRLSEPPRLKKDGTILPQLRHARLLNHDIERIGIGSFKKGTVIRGQFFGALPSCKKVRTRGRKAACGKR